MANKTALEDWKKLIDNFKDAAEDTLAKVRQCKQEVEQMKVEIFNQVRNGQFISDDRCIVLSAPRIIIGNVTKDGTLRSGGGEVIIRGNALNLDGIGQAGAVTMRAPLISQSAVDPGIDGREAVVYPISQISSHARSVVIDSQSPVADDDRQATFLPKGGVEGITLSADQGITIAATPANATKKEFVNLRKKELESAISTLKQQVQSKQQAVKNAVKTMNDILAPEDKLVGNDDDDVRANVLDIDELSQNMREYLPFLYNSMIEYTNAVSDLAELNRQKKNFEAEIKAADSSKDDYKKSTGARLVLQSENIDLQSIDGDHTLRTNEGAGITLTGNDIKLQSLAPDKDGKVQLTPKDANGRVTIQSRNVTITTANIQDAQFTDKGQLKSAKFPLEGDVTIQSKTINMEAVDLEQTDESGKRKETKLTEGSEINLRANKVRVKAINEKGESVGNFSVHSKDIALSAATIDGYKPELETDDQGNRKLPEQMKAKELTKDSTMLLMTDKMYLGAMDKNTKSKHLQAVSEEIGLFADKTLEAQQSDGKAVVQLAGGDLAIGGSKTQVYGATTINAKTEVKDELKAPKATIDNIEAKSSFKSTNISDGIAVPAPPSSASLSAKLKPEDAPKNS